jgi:hypothetical protein
LSKRQIVRADRALRRPAIARYQSLDDAKQPQDEDEDQDSAETDVHEMLLLFGFAAETVSQAPAFHSFRFRH